MIALHARHLTGRGQHVDVSMQAAMANTLGNARLYWEKDGIITERAGGARAFADRATRIIYPCADGYVAFVRVPASMIRLHKLDDRRGRKPAVRRRTLGQHRHRRRQPALGRRSRGAGDLRSSSFFADHAAQSLYESGQHFNVMICPVNTMQDIVDSPQLNAREFFERSRRPGARTHQGPGSAAEDVCNPVAHPSGADAGTTQRRDISPSPLGPSERRHP